MLLDNYSIGVTLTQILSRWKRLVSRKARFNLFLEKYCESNSLLNIESVDNTELGYTARGSAKAIVFDVVGNSRIFQFNNYYTK